jgi:integrase
MGQVFDHADVHELETCRNPVSKVRVPSSDDDDTGVRILQPEETWQIVALLQDPEKTLVLLIAATGLRISEAPALQ